MPPNATSLPLGIVIRKSPGVTRWAAWVWKAVAVLPGAGGESWRELRREGDVVDYHAGTVRMELFRTDTEAYLTTLAGRTPSVCVVMRPTETPTPPANLKVVLATASAYEAQDYCDNAEDIVELVPMPEGLIAFIQDFCDAHHQEDVFVKRRRNKTRVDLREDGKGDSRIRQTSDVYRAPRTGVDAGPSPSGASGKEPVQ